MSLTAVSFIRQVTTVVVTVADSSRADTAAILALELVFTAGYTVTTKTCTLTNQISQIRITCKYLVQNNYYA